jgi:hypothetical protein
MLEKLRLPIVCAALAIGGCIGGQTGDPTSGQCKAGATRIPYDQPSIGGATGRDLGAIVTGVRMVPIYWSTTSEDASIPGFDAQTPPPPIEDQLTLEVTSADEYAELREAEPNCQPTSLAILVDVAATTRNSGLELHFSASAEGTPERVSISFTDEDISFAADFYAGGEAKGHVRTGGGEGLWPTPCGDRCPQ